MKDPVNKMNAILTEMQAMSLQFNIMFGINISMDNGNVEGAQCLDIDEDKVGGLPTSGNADTPTISGNEWTSSLLAPRIADQQPLVGTIVPPNVPPVKENKPPFFHPLGSPIVSPGLEKTTLLSFEFILVSAPVHNPFHLWNGFPQ